MTLRNGWTLLILASTSWAQQYVISTVAGGAPPPTPAPGLTVPIGRPQGTATDAAGNLYFTSLNCVFKLDLNGVVSRLAGTSRAGFSGDSGAATLAQLWLPNGIAVDSAGSVFFADVATGRVRKIANGIITTIAGTGSDGFSGDGGPAANAQLQSPNDVAVDRQGNIFIADTGNNRVRKVSTSGVISTVAGTASAGSSGDGGLAVNAQLSQPQNLAVDGQGNVFISDTGNNRVRKVSATGVITTLAGTGVAGFSGNGGLAANAQLRSPLGLAVDAAGNVFIVDSGNYLVRKVSSAGVITTVAGDGGNGTTGDGGLATNASINGSYGVAVDASGDLFLASWYSYTIRRISADGIINTVAGTGGIYSGDNGPAPAAQFNTPGGIAVDGSGNFFVGDGSARVRRVAANGIVTTVAGNGACCGGITTSVPATGANVSPERLTVDSSGNLFITDFFSAVRKVSPGGIITTVAGTGQAGSDGDNGPATSARLGISPGGVALDSSGNIYVADTANNRVRKVSNGIITTVAGTGTAGSTGDNGLATAAQLSRPTGLAVDASGNLYIVDSGNNRMRKVSPAGTITTLAGIGTGGFSGDGGAAVSAQLQGPQGVAVDGQGNVFIADTGNYRVREVSPNGIITTVAGNSSSYYSGDCGPAPSAELSGPTDLAIDGSGNIYIADSGNNAIRRLQPTGQPTLVCAVADAASEGAGPVSPGKIVVIYGTGLGPAAISVAAPVSGAFGTQLAGTSVSVNGVPAPLIYSLAGQVSAIIPYATTGSSAQVAVSYQGNTSTFAVPVVAAAPSLFTLSGLGFGQAAAVNVADSTLNGANPVAVGAYIELFATGEGLTSPAGVDGALAPLVLPLPAPVLPVQATVGGLPANVIYAGAAPGAVAGLMQVDVQIPAGVQPGSQVPVVLQVGAATSSPAVWIAVSGNAAH